MVTLEQSERQLLVLSLVNSCATDEEANISSNSSEQTNTPNSNNISSNNNNSSSSNSESVINSNFECGNGYYYLSRPEPSESDNTHRYYEYDWQSNPPVCVNVYQAELLGGRDEKLKSSMDWLKTNLPNIIPINVFANFLGESLVSFPFLYILISGTFI